ncbi:unnamed protein product [Cuscuta epithymum]|uniref:RING-type domain-containing protein n=1 Tax=Cuscuta epithymum TaxID=186058 RepID=A0AAV0CDF7_9ASTE|nr:unnamed protein product [Cuscuta epithymum]
MASMVAKACTPTTSTQISQVMTVSEKGSRNKRKFRADPPLADLNKFIPTTQNDCTSYEFSVDKFGIIPSHRSFNGCDMCCGKHEISEGLKLDLRLSCAVGSSEAESSRPTTTEDVEATEDCRDADWNDLTESQLEELLLTNLDAIYKSAIKKLVSCGYSEEIANKAVLRYGFCYGGKDIVSNIVDNAQAFLNSGQEIDSSQEHYFEDLQHMKNYVLAELVCVLQEVKPFFSTGDAMWCLLICDMNVSHACALDDPLSCFVGEGASNENSPASLQPRVKADWKSIKSTAASSCQQATSAFCAYCPSSITADTASTPYGHNLLSDAPATVPHTKPQSIHSSVLNGLVTEKQGSTSLFSSAHKSFSAAGISHPLVAEKFVSSRKNSGTTKRECVLRQKSIHLEKHYRTYGSKGSRAGKMGKNFGGLLLDKKLKAVADSTGLTMKTAPFKINTTKAEDQFQSITNHYVSTSTGLPSTSIFCSENASATLTFPVSTIPSLFPPPSETSPSLPVADTENFIPLPSKCISIQMPISSSNEELNYGNTAGDEKHITQWAARDKKEEMILKLVPRVRELQNQLQDWTEWANQKVMQAARRLSKDKVELKTLRQEKEEVERLKKEKKMLEENTMKKLQEMASALGKASGQVDRANAAVRRLDVENAVLRREMEAAKLYAADSAASCQEVSMREKNTLIRFHSWEKQKTMFQDELATEKCKSAQLQKDIEQAKHLQNKLEARWKLEQNSKEEFLSHARSLRKERQQIDASFKSKEDAIKLKAEGNLQKYKEDIEKLEKEISQLRLKTDALNIAALRRGVDGSYASKLTDFKTHPQPKENHLHHISRLIADFRDYCKPGGVKRERECVMCLSEEMSVVFLPCAHQVVCTTCNELHKKQGMKDCPSCRSPIQQRVCARFPRS